MCKILGLYPPAKLKLRPSEAERYAINQKKRLLKERRLQERKK